MPTRLPPVIQDYLDAAAAPNDDALVACFTDDAIVVDDGSTYRGVAEIGAWRKRLAAAFDFTVQVIEAVESGPSAYVVAARVSGTFPGSPVELRYQFTVVDGLIDRLEIAP